MTLRAAKDWALAARADATEAAEHATEILAAVNVDEARGSAAELARLSSQMMLAARQIQDVLEDGNSSAGNGAS